jgi:hypothetical protein
VYDPEAVPAGTVTVNMDEPEANNGFMPKPVVQPLGIMGVESVTGLLNPLRNVAVIVEGPEVPALIVIGDDAEIVKSGVV